MDFRFSAAEQAEVWDRYEAGEYMRPIARAIGRSQGSVRYLITKTGGVRPLAPTEWSDARLSLMEREEISRGIAGGESLRRIALRLGRAPSTVSREVAANGGRLSYRACDAHTLARLGARRPKAAKLAVCPRLRRVVEAKLEKRWSPQQIADWLPRAYPKHPEMRVSHETTCRCLSRAEGRYATSCSAVCARVGRCAVRRGPASPAARGSSTTWS